MKNRQSKISRRQTRQAWLSVLPALLLILVMCAYPIVQTVIKSFTDWNGIGAAVSVGFKNYINILSSGQFWSLLRNNLIFLLFIPFQILIGVIVAVLIYDGILGGKIFRVIYYIPQVISAVIVGYLFKVLFSYDGAVNSVLKALHLIREAIPWLERSGTARTAVIICLVWVNIGWQCLLALGGLSSISPSVYEAARLDGAGYWTQLFRITFPLLGRTVEYSCITSVMWTFTGIFPYIYSMTGGGPGYDTTTLDYMVYLKSFSANSQYGYASALSVLLIIVIMILTVVQLRISDRQNRWEG